MVISQPPGNNPSYYYRASHCFASIALNASRDTLCSIHAITTSGQLIEMVLLSIFYTNQIHGGIISRLFFIHFVWLLMRFALHLAVKILLQIFLYEDLSTLALHTSVGCISLRMPAGPHFVTQPILLSENIPNI